MEMHSIMNVEGKGGLRFGAMEALATTDGRGKRPAAATRNYSAGHFTADQCRA